MLNDGNRWSINKNLSIGIALSVVGYSVWIVNWAVSVKHDVDIARVELAQISKNLSSHEIRAAHGTVLPTLAALKAEVDNIEKWRDQGGRFTESDGAALKLRIDRIEQMLAGYKSTIGSRRISP